MPTRQSLTPDATGGHAGAHFGPRLEIGDAGRKVVRVLSAARRRGMLPPMSNESTHDAAAAYERPPQWRPYRPANLPGPMDPRGLLTFGLSGLGLLVLTWQSRRSATLPGNLAALGVTVRALLIVVYLGRLIILTPTNLLVAIPAAATGLILSPLFYIWLGMELRRR